MTIFFRSLVVTLGGGALGFAVWQAWEYLCLWLKGAGVRFRGMFLVRVGVIGSILYMEGVLAARLASPTLTWRSPAAALVYGLLLVGLYGIWRDDERTRRDFGDECG